MGPLAGKRIVEIGGIGPAPVCGMLFADMGAEVILIDRKSAEPRLAPTESRFAIMHRGKQSVALDLKSDGAADIVLDLLRGADGLIEGFRPGVMERLGLSPEACLDVNPRLVYGRVTGWGQAGPLARAAGHDLNFIALAGALWHGSRAGQPPLAPPTVVGDVCGGAMNLAIGMLAALLHASQTGEGQVVDAAITDGAAIATILLHALVANGAWNPDRERNLFDGGAPWYDTYECSDGRYVSLGALEPGFYALLLEKLGLADDPEFGDQFDAARWPAQKSKIAAIMRSRTREDWCRRLEGTDVCFAPVLDLGEAAQHPHNAARGTFIEIDGVRQPAPAPRFGETPSPMPSPPPEPGADTDAVLAAIGYDAGRLDALRAQGVI